MQVTNLKLGVGIPLSFPFTYASFYDTSVMAIATAMMNGIQMEFIRKGSGDIIELRNEIVRSARETNCSHLIMMDADMTYPPETLVHLMKKVDRDKPVVGALCFRRYAPFSPLMLRGYPTNYKEVTEWESGSMVEVDATGTGCLCIHMSVFEELDFPWFQFRTEEVKKKTSFLGEDIGFCYDMRQRGHSIYVDTSIEVGHLATLEVNEKFWRLYTKLIELNSQGGT